MSELPGGPVRERRAREVDAQLHLPAQERLGQEPAEVDHRVRGGGLGAAAAVRRRARVRARRARADAEDPAAVDVGDRAAAGADRVDVDHRDHRLVGADLGVEQVLHAQAALLREADVRRRAAHVERDHVVVAGLLAGPDAADDAGDRSGHEQVHGPRDGALGRRHAARGRHQVQLRPDVQLLELLLEPPDVARDLRPDVRVEAHGGEALVLAVLRQHLRGDGEKRLGELLADELGHALLVLRVEEREQEADGDRLDPRRLQLAHALPRALLVERHEHGAVLQDPLGHRQPVAAPHDRVPLPRQVLVVREVQRLLVPCDVEDVAVALRRDQPDRRTAVLDHDVRRDRGPVEDLVERGRRLARLLRELADPLDRALRGIVGRRRQLVDEDGAGGVVDVDEVREGAADVDSEALHVASPGLRTILPKCSRRSIVSIASRACSSGKTL